MAVQNRPLDEVGLHDVHATSRLGPYLRAMWARRNYIVFVANSTLSERQINSVLGNLWHLLNPILQISVYYVIFGLVLEVDRGVDNFIAFLTIGTLIFTSCQRSTIAGSRAVVSNLGLVRAVSFPRSILPVTSTLTETIAMVPSIVVIAVVSLATGETAHPRWLLLIPLLAVFTLFNLGAAMYAARATTHLRDVQQVLPFVFRILLYASGVLFSADEYAQGAYRWLFTLNPIYCFLTLCRWSILGGTVEGRLAVSAAVWTIAILLTGFAWFRAGEATYGRE